MTKDELIQRLNELGEFLADEAELSPALDEAWQEYDDLMEQMEQILDMENAQ